MRLVVNGQQAFGKSVLEKILAKGTDEVIAVYGNEDKPGARPDPLVAFAREKGIRLEQPKSFKEEPEWEKLKAMAPDLCVMAYVTKFVPSGFLNVPKHGTIQYHPSLLPRHRGPSSINWPIIHGETKTGLTIFWPDDGLDTGPILLQKETPDRPRRHARQRLLRSAVIRWASMPCWRRSSWCVSDKAPKIVQDESKHTYESWCRADNVGVDWSKPVAEIYNLIRGADPQPGAWTTIGGVRVALFDARRGDGYGCARLRIAVDDKGMTVAAQGGASAIGRCVPTRARRLAAAQLAAAARPQGLGRRLG